MAVMGREEQLHHFERLKHFIDGTGLTAEILEENPAVPALSLLIGIPSEEPEENGVERFLVMNHIPVEEKDSRYTYYFHLLSEIPLEAGALDTESVMLAVNAMNAVTNVGHFVYTRADEEKARVQMRYTIAADVEESLPGSVLYECVDFIFSACRVMEEILEGIAAGMPLSEIFAAEGIERGTLGWG